MAGDSERRIAIYPHDHGEAYQGSVSKVAGVTVTGTPVAGSKIVATSAITAQWSAADGSVTVYFPSVLILSTQV